MEKIMTRTTKQSLRMTVIVLMTVFLTAGLAAAKEAVIIFHAGSLTVPLAQIEKDFEARNPDLDIQREAGGSTKMARMISELHKPADIMASADYKVIEKTLMPKYADWNIRFATNRLVLCYTDQSRFADEITKDNWFDILAREKVVWGHSDPNLDPCGYRSLMVLQLAEIFYNQKGLYDRLIANRPEANVRPKSVELVSLLKTGHMDYAWEYRSVAVQHELKFVELDDHINLGNYAYDDFYKQANVKVSGKKPGTWITRTGQSCTYGVTMVKDSPNPKGAERFMTYLLDPHGGMKVLESMGQPPFIPCRVASEAELKTLPASLQKLATVNP
jgi:molybdate/tungstate transport system substrate-binding protein